MGNGFDKPIADSKTSTAKGWGLGCLVLVVLIVGGGLLFGLISYANRGEPSYLDAPQIHAESACKDAVESQLKAPDSAKFTDVSAVSKGDHWQVTGYVDAQNSFGAMLRSSFSCDANVTEDSVTTSNVVIR